MTNSYPDQLFHKYRQRKDLFSKCDEKLSQMFWFSNIFPWGKNVNFDLFIYFFTTICIIFDV